MTYSITPERQVKKTKIAEFKAAEEIPAACLFNTTKKEEHRTCKNLLGEPGGQLTGGELVPVCS